MQTWTWFIFASLLIRFTFAKSTQTIGQNCLILAERLILSVGRIIGEFFEKRGGKDLLPIHIKNNSSRTL